MSEGGHVHGVVSFRLAVIGRGARGIA